MPIRQSPGVYTTEIDRTGGATLIGTGGIGLPVKLNKGPIGIAFQINSEKELINLGGMPIPEFNLVSWHSASNMLGYGSVLVLSRVEKISFSSVHDNINQMFEIPANNAQLGITRAGKVVAFNFKDEFQMMVKNRVKFKTTHINNEFDVMNEETGIDIDDFDGGILVKNDIDMENMVNNKIFDTKGKTLKIIPSLGHKKVEYGTSVPQIKVGQVYNHMGKIVDIGNSIYNDHFIIEVMTGQYIPGNGFAIIKPDTTNTLISSDGSEIFSDVIKKGTSLNLKYWGDYGANISDKIKKVDDVAPNKTDYKAENLTLNGFGSTSLSAGDKIKYTIIGGSSLEREVLSIEKGFSIDTTGLTITDGDTLTITVNGTPYVFEFNSLEGSVSGDYFVDISGLSEITQMLSKFVSVINEGKDNRETPVDISSNILNNIYTLLRTTSDTHIRLYFGIKTSESFSNTDFSYNFSLSGNSDNDVCRIITKTITPSEWNGGDGYWQIAKLQPTVTATVKKIVSFKEIIVNEVLAIPEETLISWEYRYSDNDCLIDTTGTNVKVYQDEDDPTGLTLVLRGENPQKNLLIGTKILIIIEGTEYKTYVSEFIENSYKFKVTHAIPGLSVDPENASNFRYFNVYFNAGDASTVLRGTGTHTIYSPTGEGLIIGNDENNTPSSLLKMIVKVTKGYFQKGQELNLAKLKNTQDWYPLSNYISKIVDINKENNIYMVSFDEAPQTELESGDEIEIADTNSIKTGEADVLFVSDVTGENTDKYLVIQLKAYDNGTKKSILENNYKFRKLGYSTNYGTFKHIHNYENVIVYELGDETTGQIIMVNEDVVGLTAELKKLYTYTYTPTDKIDYVVEHISGALLTAKEFMRIFAYNAGSWINNEDVTVALCDMDNYMTAEISSGVPFKSLFSEFPPDTTDKTQFVVAVMIKNFVVEKFIVSTKPTAKDAQGLSIYAPDVINRKSMYIRVILNNSLFDPTSPTGYDIQFNPIKASKLNYGYSGSKFWLNTAYYYDDNSTIYLTTQSGYTEAQDVMTALEVYRNTQDVNISYLVDGEWSGDVTIANRIINIASERGDTIAILGPKLNDIVGVKDYQTIKKNMIDYVNNNALVNGSREAQFSGFFANTKQVYDVFNDTYVWLPISIDVAAINNYIDNFFEPWYAAAGLTRGNIRNIIKLGWNPDRLILDEMYPNRINAVVSFKGEGTVIWGVRSLCSRKSDLSDLYNRKTLNLIEKNLKRLMRQLMFEFNDAQTRGRAVALIEPFLRGIRAKRGLVDYKVVCDDSNNPASVVENNTMVCDVFLKMQHVVEVIELNFVVTPLSASFTES